MDTVFQAEYLFKQSNILFISNKKLDGYLKKYIDLDQEMISIDCPTLWELRVYEYNIESEAMLHIDLPNVAELITIKFNEEDIHWLRENQDINSLGILFSFNPDTTEAKNVVFITEIQKGLELVFQKH